MTEPDAPRDPGGPRDGRAVGARAVLLVAALVVAAVLGLQVVSLLVPAIGEMLGVAPLLIGLLVLVTASVLVGTVRPRG